MVMNSRLRRNEAVIHRSGDATGMVNNDVRYIYITRTDATPPNDPVVVDLSTLMERMGHPIAVNVQNGATVVVGGRWSYMWPKSSLKINGGTAHLRGDLTAYTADDLAITVGPSGGKITVDQHSPSRMFLKRTIQFVDGRGRITSKIPENFVVDFRSASSVVGTYLQARDVTLIGDGAARKLNSNGRILTIKGDPFHLAKIGSPIPKGSFVGSKKYIYTFTQSDGHGGVITCYLSGSEVKVPGGRVCVEALQKGAEVLVHDSRNGLERRARVVWVGKGRVHVRPHLPDDEAGWPVKILRHALGENIPYKDMCVTSEHCFFLGGVFVPVRMLVNGASIFYDKTQSYYDYWHFETECHEIIDVDGAFTETFLNTGHDHYFGASEAAPGEESAPPKSWATDAAAPLETRREVIEPLYRRLSDRSQALGLCIPHDVNEEITFDPGLALCDEQGHPFPLKEQQGHRYLFSLDGDVDSVVLLSRTSRPCDVIGPYIDDRRELGVLVGEVRLLRADGSAEGVTGFLSAPQAEGWDVQEHGPWRWMNGEARLDLPTGSGVGACLSVEVKAGGPYLTEDKNLWEDEAVPALRVSREVAYSHMA